MILSRQRRRGQPGGFAIRAWRHGRGDAGVVTAFTVVFVTALILVAGLVLDGGLALAAKVRAIHTAEEAARAGAQAVDLAGYRADGHVRLDPAGARQRAQAFLAAAGVAGTVVVTGTRVTVTVHATVPTQLLSLAGLDRLEVSGVGAAEAVRGIVTEERGFTNSEARPLANRSGGTA
ncbi:pilus assembly protein TadG-related protein [Frankia sp. CiP3]|uniref:pilus assembly protein TadG-related protein n=1 Tax=Frankia sp. CiP3 TaxID=2880971 RepID=UPI001EF72E0A|nr:pilus assembly protein TadG-related protein [Frankia sp. CiP3]